jgi:hypothetical protein
MKFAYFAAVSVVVIAQAASAQVPATGRSNPLAGSALLASKKLTNQAMTIMNVYPTNSVYLFPGPKATYGGGEWSFRSEDSASAGATVAGVAVAPNALKKGMKCVLDGTVTPGLNIITKLAC